MLLLWNTVSEMSDENFRTTNDEQRLSESCTVKMEGGWGQEEGFLSLEFVTLGFQCVAITKKPFSQTGKLHVGDPDKSVYILLFSFGLHFVYLFHKYSSFAFIIAFTSCNTASGREPDRTSCVGASFSVPDRVQKAQDGTKNHIRITSR